MSNVSIAVAFTQIKSISRNSEILRFIHCIKKQYQITNTNSPTPPASMRE